MDPESGLRTNFLMHNTDRPYQVGMAAVLLLLGSIVFAGAAGAAGPALPHVTSLQVQPSSLTLNDARDARSIVVTGKTAAGYSIDLSGVATVKPAQPIVRVGKDGFVEPVRAGK